MTIEQWLRSASAQLSEYSDSPLLDAQLLLAHVLQQERTYLYTWGDRVLSTDQQQQVEQLLSDRLTGHPVAYLLGWREFWSLPLKVSPATLIPRADTETLVEWALELDLPDQSQVLDLGTGTGAIALALASERPAWQLEGVDAQPEAVALARDNAQQLSLAVTFAQSNWFSALRERVFDLIVSNPPYISAEDTHLQQGDVRFEPGSALVAQQHGLADLTHIIQYAPEYLRNDGWLLLEHGYQQAEDVQELLKARGFKQVGTRKDLSGQPRISAGQWPTIPRQTASSR